MRPFPAARPSRLASLAHARQRAGEAPPLDWAAAAIDEGRLIEPQRRAAGPRWRRLLRRAGLAAADRRLLDARRERAA